MNWAWSSNFVYKLYPDVLAFYITIALTAATSLVMHNYDFIRQFLHRRAWVRFMEYYGAWDYLFPCYQASVARRESYARNIYKLNASCLIYEHVEL